MPWQVKHVAKSKKPWKIIRSDTGKVVGSSTTKAKAQGSVRARYQAVKAKETI